MLEEQNNSKGANQMKMMKCLELPHGMAPYRCPVNGLSDVYEWKTGKRIPEYLLHDSRLGCKVISGPGMTPSPMVFFGEGEIGRRDYRFWKDKLGYRMIEGEDQPFAKTVRQLRQLIDEGIPVILFGLDLYHLPYHQQFYHQVHIPGHVNLMVGYDDESVYLHDNDREGVQAISYLDLEKAWADGYMGFSKRNTYFGIDMARPNPDIRGILRTAFGETAAAFLTPAGDFTGEKGYLLLVRKLEEWAGQPATDQLKQICEHLVTFTASVIPELPGRLLRFQTGVVNPHRAGRDTFASALRQWEPEYGDGTWIRAADCFEKSGLLMERATNIIADAVLAGNYAALQECVPLFEKVRELETEAFGYWV